MHILVINDDGPPTKQSSPFVHPLVRTLQDAGHKVSVILPHIQRSWIGKAHFVGEIAKPTYYRPGKLYEYDGTTHSRPLPKDAKGEEWVLVDGTPATCAQLGLYHFFQDQGPVDLVVSGPNYGRNSTALLSLSSGTIGGAMEATLCHKKAIAISYAFYSKDRDLELIASASCLSAKLIEYLHANWAQDVDLYSINIPLIKDVEHHKIMYTDSLSNRWLSGCPYKAIEPRSEEEPDPSAREEEIRHGGIDEGAPSGKKEGGQGHARHTHKHFQWSPAFTDVAKSIEANPPGNDGWALGEGYTSVTPLKANFMHASLQLKGELKLSGTVTSNMGTIHMHIEYGDEYVQPLVLSATRSQFDGWSCTFISSPSGLPKATDPFLQITSYESIDFEHLLANPSTSMANSYVIRKALIRKHYLSNTVSTWLAKNPESPLKYHVKPTLHLELDYAEFLDEALLEAYELNESFACNAEKGPVNREWWILKPSMSDRGQGIRLFSTEEELRSIFEQWEAEQPDSGAENEGEEDSLSQPDTTLPPPFDPTAPILDASKLSTEADDHPNGIITSQLRHFVVQPYIHPPLLFPEHQNRKFHIRSYVLAVGALKVYVYKEMLALFAVEPYTAPGSEGSAGDDGEPDLRAHLTNTCLQDGTREGSVVKFWDLPGTLPTHPSQPSSPRPQNANQEDWKTSVFTQIFNTISALFLAASQSQTLNFQVIPNAFEIFGLDWMVDCDGGVWLLEVNAFPDFGQTGGDLKEVVKGLWEGVVRVACKRFFEGRAGGEGDVGWDTGEEGEMMRQVLDVDLGRG